ncbi:MAG TPA: nicotinate phosphoribosyltransferase [Gammaproteobacteria bacterium]|nr:nicotinate phosphoribosyltransferase [Gammaproteobacteria bacterium]
MQHRDDRLRSALLTDLYQLTMLQSYYRGGMSAPAVFEFFVRRLPPQRNFLIAAGLAELVDYLTSLRFTPEDLAALEATRLFEADFLDYLAALRFTGDVDAIPEGTACFPDEPLVRVTAPLPEAQLVESRLINLVHFETLIASKAARVVLAADGALLVDFGMRRAHGAEAALLAARASYLAGFAGTATVAAHPRYGIPVFGTMAHSFIQAHDSESEAFERFARGHRGSVVLLIDTYDTEAGARRVAELAPRLARDGIAIHSVRIDSGDLDALSRAVRRILDEAGCGKIGIFASGGLDEHAVADLRKGRAPIDGFGIGTSLDASTDAPTLDCAYKLEEYAGRPRRKLSPGKATWPGTKQVYRTYDDRGRMARDVVTLAGDPQPGEALLVPVLRGGRLVEPLPGLDAIRERAAASLAALPAALRSLDESASHSVEMAPALVRLAESMSAGRA